jgi:hypothetical protein
MDHIAAVINDAPSGRHDNKTVQGLADMAQAGGVVAEEKCEADVPCPLAARRKGEL